MPSTRPARSIMPIASSASSTVRTPSPATSARGADGRSSNFPRTAPRSSPSAVPRAISKVTRSGVIRGRAGIRAMLDRVLGDPENLGFRMASAVDAAGTTFRYRSFVVRRDGRELEFFDAGELDADGKITTLLVFAGSLDDA
jgi:hypothetical protein